MEIVLRGKLLIKRIVEADTGFIFLLIFKKGSVFMCMKNYQPVDEYYSPCGKCPDYLCTCMPVIIDGFIFGECDLVACEFCSCEDCEERSC